MLLKPTDVGTYRFGQDWKAHCEWNFHTSALVFAENFQTSMEKGTTIHQNIAEGYRTQIEKKQSND